MALWSNLKSPIPEFKQHLETIVKQCQDQLTHCPSANGVFFYVHISSVKEFDITRNLIIQNFGRQAKIVGSKFGDCRLGPGHLQLQIYITHHPCADLLYPKVNRDIDLFLEYHKKK